MISGGELFLLDGGGFFLEYFKLDGYYNVICIDWSLFALDMTYLAARLRCKEIGNYVAELILALLDKTDLKLDTVHVIGFSMGAHIAGYVGKRFEGRIPRITGMRIMRTYQSSAQVKT